MLLQTYNFHRIKNYNCPLVIFFVCLTTVKLTILLTILLYYNKHLQRTRKIISKHSVSLNSHSSRTSIKVSGEKCDCYQLLSKKITKIKIKTENK